MTVDLSEARDLELLGRVRAGDTDSFRALFDRYAPTAHALALRIVRHGFLAEEIVQEAFLALWKQAANHDPRRGSVRAWLLGMVHHRAVDAVRREEAQRRRAEDAVVVLEPADDEIEELDRELDRPGEASRVRSALRALPEEQRTVIELMYFGGLSQSAIAERLSVPLGTVKSRTLLAMRRMRGALEEP